MTLTRALFDSWRELALQERVFAEKRTIEAGARSGVAGRTCGIHEREQRVLVAIVAQIDQLLRVARLFALVPELVARTRPEPGGLLFEGSADSLFIHPGHHEHLVSVRILYDAGDETGFVVSKICQIHGGFLPEEGGKRMK